MPSKFRCAFVAFSLAAVSCTPAQDSFALHNGDRVVWYGDSITDNSPYCLDVEAYTLMRYPNLNVRFFNAGMGGDQVRGGGLGPVDLRLTRDVFSRQPTVITSMLGMNDAHYSSFSQPTFDKYLTGYQHIVDRLKAEAPGARVWLFRPSPFDEVTRATHPGGMTDSYNAVLLQFAAGVDQLAQTNGLFTVDQNQPMLNMLARASSTDAENAKLIIRDQVHPGGQGDLILAEQVIKAWHGSPLVSDVTVDATGAKASGKNCHIANVQAVAGTVSWTETDLALPFPVDRREPLTALVINSSDFDQAVNQEMLRVTNLTPGSYRLRIDRKEFGPFTADQLGAGINLATLPTPMYDQATKVLDLTRKRCDLFYQRWRQLDVELQDLPSPTLNNAKAAIDAEIEELVRQQQAAAQPQTHTFTLSPGT